jgi:hypothetical protein
VYGATTGKPLRDIRVAAMRDGAIIEDAPVAVDSDGAYTRTLLASPGDYVILAIPWRLELDEANLELGVPVHLGPGDVRNLDLTFPDTFSLSVQVVDSAGTPIQGVTTAITEDDHTWSPAGETDAEGRFSWSGFRAGTTGQIVLFDSRMPIAVTEAVTGESGVDYPEQVITLVGNGGIEGTAVDGSGQPLATGLLLVEVAGREGAPVDHQAPTDATGHFLIGSGIPATGVVLHIIGYTEDAQGISRHGTGDIELEVEADQIVDLGAVPFVLEETGLQP